MISVFVVLIFIPASKHASENRSSTYWGPFCSSLTMQGHLETAGAKHYTPQMSKCATTGETVSVYLVYIYNEQKRRKNTALS